MRPLIEGDDNFKIKTLEALILIQYKSEEKFNIVLKYIGRIIRGGQSVMRADANPPAFVVGERTYLSQTEWYAGCIVHDAYHSKLYHDYLEKHSSVPDDVWTGEKAEYACLEYQISFLEEIGAAQHNIDHAKSLRTSRWWEANISW